MPTADVEKELLELRGIAEEYRALKNQLLEPPRGWFVLGSHIDQPDVCLEFWGDEGGVPLWERPVPAMDTKYVVTVLVDEKSSRRLPEAMGAIAAWMPDATITAAVADDTHLPHVDQREDTPRSPAIEENADD
tara:strand:+ start:77109 stop:77507 length:399 start_codon:yes stop_codon:yes gene_type:complete